MEDSEFSNEFNNTDQEPHSEGQLPTSAIVRIVVFALTAVLVLGGNITVVFLISWQPRLRAVVTNVYIIQRAIADILSVPPAIVGYARSDLFAVNNVLVCTMNFMEYLSVFVNVSMLVLLAMDCYLASRPQHHSQQYRWMVLKITSGLTWPLGSLVAFGIMISIYFRRIHMPVYWLLGITAFHILTILVALVICWVYVCFIYAPKTVNTTEGFSNTSRPDEGNTTPPRLLILALVTTHTVQSVPANMVMLILMWWRIYNEYIMTLTLCLTDVCYALTPILYMWLQKDLKQSLMKCVSRRISSATIPLDGR